MPRRLVASMMVLPSGTSIVLPSISRSSMSLDVVRHKTLLVLDVVFELFAVVLDERADRHCGGVPQRADRAALDVVRDFIEKIEVLALAPPVLDAVDHAKEPAGAFAAGR